MVTTSKYINTQQNSKDLFTTAIEYVNCLSTERREPLASVLETICWWGFNPGGLGNTEYSFIVITLTHVHTDPKWYICKQPLMMAYETSESARDNFDKFIHQFQPETKTLT